MTSPRLPIACGLLALLGSCVSAATEPGPNVVLILADDLGYRDLGSYGHPSLRTPALDRLAESGVRLTDFHSGATVCTPSRMALLTGCYPPRVGWTTGVLGFGMALDEGMDTEVPTLAERFRDAGYATAISGKWHLGNAPGLRPHQRGFDSSYYLALSNNQTTKVWRGDEVVEDPFENRLLTRQITDEAVRFVRANADRPFFLYLPFTAPHFPVEAHPDWEGRSNFGAYGDVVEELDACVGEVMAALGELGLEENTLVVFTSDNGPNPHEAADCAPFRGEKWSALEGGTRVPAIASWPGVIPAGAECDELISAMDLVPTLCRAARVGVDDGLRLDGLDVWDTLVGEEGSHPREELLYWHGQDPAPQAIRVGDWKLFLDRRHALRGIGTARATAEQDEALESYRSALTPDEANPPMLFDLATDPGETVDRSAEHPGRVAELAARAEALFAEVEAGRVEAPGESD